jgi:hypothetical protein
MRSRKYLGCARTPNPRRHKTSARRPSSRGPKHGPAGAETAPCPIAPCPAVPMPDRPMPGRPMPGRSHARSPHARPPHARSPHARPFPCPAVPMPGRPHARSSTADRPDRGRGMIARARRACGPRVRNDGACKASLTAHERRAAIDVDNSLKWDGKMAWHRPCLRSKHL